MLHAFFRYVQSEVPERMLQCQKIMAMPLRRHVQVPVAYMSKDELTQVLAHPDPVAPEVQRATSLTLPADHPAVRKTIAQGHPDLFALERVPDDSINFIAGFDGFVVGNMKEIRRIFDLFGVQVNIICDPSGNWNTPTDGEFRMYAGGTSKEEVVAALHAKATIVFQEFCCEKTSKFIAEHGQEVVTLNAPIGVAGTDQFLMEISRLTGKPIPAELEKERGELVDAMADSQAHLHGKRYALYGDPDQMLGYAQFLLELGAEPSHVLATNGTETWAAKVQALFDSSPYGAGCKVYPKRDLWHLRSLLFTEPVDFLIGNTYGKYLERDTKTPLVRMVFPIFDRHHYHRFPTWGYDGGMRVLVTLLDEFFETLDANTIIPGKTDYSYDIIR